MLDNCRDSIDRTPLHGVYAPILGLTAKASHASASAISRQEHSTRLVRASLSRMEGDADEAVRTAASPDDVLLDFLQSTYEAAANLGNWDRAALERPAMQARH